jgi:Spy/CpxP family protein refolding chaperone
MKPGSILLGNCLLLLILSACWPAQAAPDSDLEKLWQLDLTEDQEQEITKLERQCDAQLETLRRQLGKERAKLRRILASDAASDAEIQRQKAKIEALEAGMSDLEVRSWLRMKQVLTEEQQERLREIKFSD